jgi:hypothetical protein
MRSALTCASVTVAMWAPAALAQTQPAWTAMGSLPGQVRDFVVHNGQLHAAGTFTGLGELLALEGYVARWDGTTWQRLGGAIGAPDPGVTALASWNGELFASAHAATASGPSVFRWNGTAWQGIASPGVGDASNLAVFDGALWASGKFEVSGTAQSVDAAFVRRWNGQTWDTPGGTVVIPRQEFFSAQRVIAMEVIDGAVLVGGDRSLRRWDGTAWTELPAPPDFVLSITKHDDDLFVGLFPLAAAAPSNASSLQRLVENQWVPATGLPRRGQARDLISYQGELIVTGFEIADSVTAAFAGDSLPQVTGALRWLPGPRRMGQGLSGTVRTAIEFEDKLIVGGLFTTDGNGQPLQFVAMYQGGADPVFTQQPVDMPLACNASQLSAVTATAQTASDPAIFVTNTATGEVQRLLAAPTVSPVTISWTPLARNRGQWQFIATDTNGSSRSRAFAVPVYDIDFNNNGVFPEDQDVIDFFNVVAGGTCSTPAPLGCDSIDTNNDGVFPDDQDVIDFFVILAGGIC